MTTHVQQTLPSPLARWALMQPATIDLTLDLCARYPLRLGGPRKCGIRSLPDTSTHGQHWESNPRPSDLESNALTTGPHAPNISWRDPAVICFILYYNCVSISVSRSVFVACLLSFVYATARLWSIAVNQMQPVPHPELSGCITTLSVCNTWRLQTFVQQWTPW